MGGSFTPRLHHNSPHDKQLQRVRLQFAGAQHSGRGGDGLVMVVGGTSGDLLLMPIVLLRCSEL